MITGNIIEWDQMQIAYTKNHVTVLGHFFVLAHLTARILPETTVYDK